VQYHTLITPLKLPEFQFVDQGFGLASEAGCKKPFSFSKADLAKRFLDLANAPDALVPGINYDELPCPKGKKASKKCKEKEGNGGDDDSPPRSADNEQPSQTNNDQPSRTSSQASSTTTSALATPKTSCEEIGRRDFEQLSKEYPSDEEFDEPEVIEERSRPGITFHDRRLKFEERAAKSFRPKKATACEGSRATKLNSKAYPGAEQAIMVCAPIKR
jgi:hypothetical protein